MKAKKDPYASLRKRFPIGKIVRGNETGFRTQRILAKVVGYCIIRGDVVLVLKGGDGRIGWESPADVTFIEDVQLSRGAWS